jgi:hypothetical protein
MAELMMLNRMLTGEGVVLVARMSKRMYCKEEDQSVVALRVLFKPQPAVPPVFPPLPPNCKA